MTSLPQLEAARRAVAETGRKYMVYYSERLHSEAATLADYLIKQNTIGRVLHIEGFGPHRLGGPRPAWFYEKARYGGILCDIGSHQLEQFLYFAGVENVDITFARKANYAHPATPEFEDFGECTATAALSLIHISSTTADGKTQLNILWWGSQTRHELTTQMLEKFQEENPDIEVVMDYSDWDGYWTKLPAQVAGGQTPDVFQMDYAKLAQYVENGVMAPLDDYVADGSLDLSNVAQSVIDSGSIDGKLYAVSTGTNAPVMLYRKDILDDLGIEMPMNRCV